MVVSEEKRGSATAVDDPGERQALAAILGGDSSAYDYLVSKHMRRCLSIAWGIVRDAAEAEDLAQEAFVRAYEKIGSFRMNEPFGPWIYRIVTNLSLDVAKHRSRVRNEELGDDQQAARQERGDVQVASNEIARRIDRAIESLPEMQGIVVRLFLVEEFEHAEIAAMTGLTEGTIRSHLSHGRKKLQSILGDLQGEWR